MVLFHLQFAAPSSTDSNRFTVELSHPIPMQTLKLVKSCVHMTYSNTNPHTNSTIFARIPWLTHYEITSNTAESYLPIQIQPTPLSTAGTPDNVIYSNHTYDIRFKCDDIPTKFDVDFFKDTNGTAMPFNNTGLNKVRSIDLYFEYATNDAFH